MCKILCCFQSSNDNTGRFARRQAGAGANQFPLECPPWGKDDHYVSTKGVALGMATAGWSG